VLGRAIGAASNCSVVVDCRRDAGELVSECNQKNELATVSPIGCKELGFGRMNRKKESYFHRTPILYGADLYS
jgi:hypothetical protein